LSKPISSTHCNGNILKGKPPPSCNNNGFTLGCVENQASWQGPFFEQKVYTPSFALVGFVFKLLKVIISFKVKHTWEPVLERI